MQSELHLTNPTLTAVLNFWHQKFSDLRIIDLHLFYEQHEAFELKAFQGTVYKSIEKCKEVLLKQ